MGMDDEQGTDRPSDEAWRALGDASFVSVGTMRRDGTIVRTPVWIAPLDDALVLTTEIATGKVRRLRRDPRVVLRICDRMGRLRDGAPEVHATGELVDDDATTAAAMGSLRSTYGVQLPLVLGLERLVRRVQRRRGERVIVRIVR